MLTEIKFAPGIDKQDTSVGAAGRWVDSDLARFRYGLPEKIGGWQSLLTDTIVGVARAQHSFVDKEMPILALLDTHEPGKPEPPYPPHCELGTGEEELINELKWIENEPLATLVRKDCINGFIGAFQPDGSNAIIDWVKEYNVNNVLVVGICTDICVMDFVLTLLSARNHGMLNGLKEVVVYDKGCSTFDLPRSVAKEIGLPKSASHPQNFTHYMGLYFMASRGAKLVSMAKI